MSRRGRPLTKPNASRTYDGLTCLQYDLLKTACEDDDGEVYCVSTNGPSALLEKGWFVKTNSYRIYRVTDLGRKRYADAVAVQQKQETGKSG